MANPECSKRAGRGIVTGATGSGRLVTKPFTIKAVKDVSRSVGSKFAGEKLYRGPPALLSTFLGGYFEVVQVDKPQVFGVVLTPAGEPGFVCRSSSSTASSSHCQWLPEELYRVLQGAGTTAPRLDPGRCGRLSRRPGGQTRRTGPGPSTSRAPPVVGAGRAAGAGDPRHVGSD